VRKRALLAMKCHGQAKMKHSAINPEINEQKECLKDLKVLNRKHGEKRNSNGKTSIYGLEAKEAIVPTCMDQQSPNIVSWERLRPVILNPRTSPYSLRRIA